jgi:hypothetical protein
MSDLTALEKRKLEQFLGMGSGYVLDFSNRSFEEFVRDSTGREIFDQRYNYASGSKANRLRAFWQKEDNAIVAKLLGDLLDCSEATGAQVDVCRAIVSRLLNGSPAAGGPSPAIGGRQSIQQQRVTQELRRLKDVFFQLAIDNDRNRAGLALEELLNQLFELFELQPRQPFRVVGEQIDGSFQLDGQIYLIESKWENHPLPEADLLVFRGKIEAKSTFTRGVMIALNDVSRQARDAITRGKAPCFFVMNGHDLTMILSGTIGLPDYLRKRVRLLAEEGRVFVHFSDILG